MRLERVRAQAQDGIRTLSVNFPQRCFLSLSNSPFFLKVCTRPSIADLVAVGSGRSEVLNFFLGGTYSSSTAPLRTIDGDVVIRSVIQIALLVRPLCGNVRNSSRVVTGE